LCADGLIESDLQENFVATSHALMDGNLIVVKEALEQLDTQADKWIISEIDNAGSAKKIASVDMRYVGQNYELPVMIDNTQSSPKLPDRETLIEGFFAAHLRSYGYVDRVAPVEVINVRLKAVIALGQALAPPDSPKGPPTPDVIQDVWFSADAPLSTPVYQRNVLPIGTTLPGPAIILQFDATTCVPPDAKVTVDAALNLIVEL
ncbi:MAG: hypothetical protein VW665_03065, partial [Candidatus Puniceispirillum sp.]